MRIRTFLLACTALAWPMSANAAPIGAFIAGLGSLAGVGAAAAGFVGFSAFAYTAGAFFSTTFGSLLLSVGLSLLMAPKVPKAPGVEEVRVNSRVNAGPRWQLAGSVAVGGEAAIFGEHDAEGNFWYITAHGDSELTGTPQYFFDSIPVIVSDGSDGFAVGDVVTDDFCLDGDMKQYEGSGSRNPYFRVYTVTPSVGHVYGVKPTAFTAAFPELPSDFFLAGVSYTIVKCKTIGPEHYSKAYRWRGSFALGEPQVTVYANFTRMYDPRNPVHDMDNSDTWTPSEGNPVIIWAWFRTAPYGRGLPMSDINWSKVAAAADACDELVLDRSAQNIPRYRCGIAFPDNKPRHECEAEILLTCDGFVAYDDEGKAYPVVGVYEAPTLTFTAARDVLSSQTEVVDDGEAAVDGVIVNYMSEQHGYNKQACSPWINTNYYDGIRAANFLTIDILGCQNHNQAVRLAKAIGLRTASTRRAAISTTVKGILAKSERTINLDLDPIFNGEYEIITPVEEDPSGASCSFGVVPMQADRYDLLEGEEGPPPPLTPSLDIDDGLELATGVIVLAVSVATSNGSAVRLETNFNPLTRLDRALVFRYAPTGSIIYEYFIVDLDNQVAYSAVVTDGAVYDVSWQTVTAGGRASEWSAVTTITATADIIPPAALVSFSASGGVGAAAIAFMTANDLHQVSVKIRRSTTPIYANSGLVTTIFKGPNLSGSYTNSGAAPGTYYYWGVPANGSGVLGAPLGPVTAIIT
jgi:hypothetical protein